MLMQNIRFRRILVLSCLVFATTGFMSRMADASDGNVILLMLDGVRWQEVFRGVDKGLADSESGEIFSLMKHEYGRDGLILGNRDAGSEMRVANGSLMSLPAYQSIMAGFPQPCKDNDCGRIKVETLQERLVRDLGLPQKDVATIASWRQISYAVERTSGRTFVNAAIQPLDDGTADPVFEKLNRAQAGDVPPWGNARFDKYTFAHAMHYLKKHRPRFMFISLNDSDEWAHKSEYDRYVATLRQYDRWIKTLVETLQNMDAYGRNTTLIVTTDHGRGDGSITWAHHGWFLPEAKHIWLFGLGPWIGRARGDAWTGGYTHVDIRPTIEAALGLTPTKCEQCGQVIRELIPGRIRD